MATNTQTHPGSMRTFYIIWFGQFVSALGSGLTGFALGVWLYQDTGSVAYFAMSILAFMIPGIFFSPVAGALVDRFPRRWMMILSDTGAGLSTLFVLAMLLTGSLAWWHIVIANFFNALFNSFQWPAWSAATTMLVPQEQLGRASGMSQIGDALSQIISPAIAGAMFVAFGLEGVVIIDFATFLFAVLTLLAVRIPEPVISAESKKNRGSLLTEIRFGWNYITARKGLFYLLLFFAATNFLFGFMNPLMLPMLLELTTPDKVGFSASMVGVGMLVGTLVMSAWGGPKRRVFGVVGFSIWGGIAYGMLGVVPSIAWVTFWAFMLMMVFPIVGGSSQALWQAKTDPDVQGRVFSVRRTIAQFTAPIGVLLAGPLVDGVFQPAMNEGGVLASRLGPWIGVGPGRGVAALFVVLGLLQLVVAAVALANPRLRRVDLEIPNVEVKARDEEAPAVVLPEPLAAAAD
ncbi:MAG: MFS transporter [Anaerolineae bacterium]|nr:MAG: MFS transporter [Anaerolineae bacterium]